MSETRRIQATDGWTILVHPSGAIEAHDANRVTWIGLDSDNCLSIDVDGADVDFEGRASSNSTIPADVVRAVLNQEPPVADETTPDAVEAAIASLVNVLVNEYSHTSETASALDVCIGSLRHARRAERARHAEEVARLRDVHLDETRALDDLRLKEIASLRDQLREVTMERENRVAEMRAWGEAKFAGAQHEIAHLRDQLQARRG